jgi:hypothetical protein
VEEKLGSDPAGHCCLFLEIYCLYSVAGVAWAAGIEVPLSPMARLLGVSEEPVMGEGRLHVVFGTGQVGSALAAHLAWYKTRPGTP